MHNTWLDVTTILNWKRPAVGIVRTELECAIYALNQDESKKIKFCIYDPSQGYYEVKPEFVQEKIKVLSNNEIDKDKNPYTLDGKIGLIKKTKKVVLTVIGFLPINLQRKTLDYLRSKRSSVHNLITSLRYFKLSCKQWFNTNNVASSDLKKIDKMKLKKHPFNIEDTYISLGLDWDQKDFHYLYELKKELNLKVKLFCYDVIPVKLPHLCVGNVSSKFAKYFSDVAWAADEIFCISKCSRQDLKELLLYLGVPIPKLSIIRLGCEINSINKTNKISPVIEDIISQRYLLFVSTIERRKNHETIYKAYTLLSDNQVKDIPLMVFVGMSGWGVNDLLSDLNLDPRVKNKIIILSNISDYELIQLYKHTWFTVYPSLYEGWGLPVAESLSFGKYCLASSAASIPEIAGEMLDYICPLDIIEWANKIKYFIENPSEIKIKEIRIANEYKSQKWANTAKSILD